MLELEGKEGLGLWDTTLGDKEFQPCLYITQNQTRYKINRRILVIKFTQDSRQRKSLAPIW